jgi:plasmid stability protein
MAQILIRKLDEDLLRKLKVRAKAAGRSAEGEARALLQSALSRGTVKLGNLVGSGKQRGRTAREIDRYIKKLRDEWR